jgi:hypothetical protein
MLEQKKKYLTLLADRYDPYSYTLEHLEDNFLGGNTI